MWKLVLKSTYWLSSACRGVRGWTGGPEGKGGHGGVTTTSPDYFHFLADEPSPTSCPRSESKSTNPPMILQDVMVVVVSPSLPAEVFQADRFAPRSCQRFPFFVVESSLDCRTIDSAREPRRNNAHPLLHGSPGALDKVTFKERIPEENSPRFYGKPDG